MPSLEEIREALRTDISVYGRRCVRIVDKQSRVVPLELLPAQRKVVEALERQRQQGLPQRVIVLKSRKTGVSTLIMAIMMQRATQLPNRNALVVAQDRKTAGELFEVGEKMYQRLPEHPQLDLKPVLRNRRYLRLMHFGEPSREARRRGRIGLDSKIEADGARELEAGRGYTYHDLHLSEVAFWPDRGKLTSLLNAVPDGPDTMIVMESTAKGYNHFRSLWIAAENGDSPFATVFISWLEDPDCWLPFSDDAERAEFEADVGTGAYGEDEPGLLERGAALEQLHWRRWAIGAKCGGSLDDFHQEYPSTPEEAFIASGRMFFDKALVSAMIDRAKRTDPQIPSPDNPGPERGLLKAARTQQRQGANAIFEVPTKVEWWPAQATGFGRSHPFIRRFEEPFAGHRKGEACPDCEGPGHDCDSCGGSGQVEQDIPQGRYVLFVDPASGEETDEGDPDWHAMQVVDHRTKRHVAAYHSRIDPDLLGLEAFKLGLYYNTALIAVEITGGYGGTIVRSLNKDLGYRPNRIYRRKRELTPGEKAMDLLGWQTSIATKPALEATGKRLLREAPPAVLRDRLTALQLRTYIKDHKGRTGAEKGAHDDLLMGWLGAQHIAYLVRPPSDTKPKRQTSWTRPVMHPEAGY